MRVRISPLFDIDGHSIAKYSTYKQADCEAESLVRKKTTFEGVGWIDRTAHSLGFTEEKMKCDATADLWYTSFTLPPSCPDFQ